MRQTSLLKKKTFRVFALGVAGVNGCGERPKVERRGVHLAPVSLKMMQKMSNHTTTFWGVARSQLRARASWFAELFVGVGSFSSERSFDLVGWGREGLFRFLLAGPNSYREETHVCFLPLSRYITKFSENRKEKVDNIFVIKPQPVKPVKEGKWLSRTIRKVKKCDLAMSWQNLSQMWPAGRETIWNVTPMKWLGLFSISNGDAIVFLKLVRCF